MDKVELDLILSFTDGWQRGVKLFVPAGSLSPSSSGVGEGFFMEDINLDVTNETMGCCVHRT